MNSTTKDNENLTNVFQTIDEEVKGLFEGTPSKTLSEALGDDLGVEGYPRTTQGVISPYAASEEAVALLENPWRPDRVRMLRKMRDRERYLRKKKSKVGSKIKHVGWKAKKKAKSERDFRYWNSRRLWTRVTKNWKLRGKEIVITEREFGWLVHLYGPEWEIDSCWVWGDKVTEDSLVMVSGWEVRYRGGDVPEKWVALDRHLLGRWRKTKRERGDNEQPEGKRPRRRKKT